MNFLFLFGLLLLSGCGIHHIDKKEKDTKASEVEINNDGGRAFVTPSKDLKTLRLQSSFSDEFKVDKSQQPVIKSSKESIQARLVDIPIMVGAALLNASVDAKNNKYLECQSPQSLLESSAYYNDELARLGWQVKMSYSDDIRILITAKKPHKYAVISLDTIPSSWLQASYTKILITVSVL